MNGFSSLRLAMRSMLGCLLSIVLVYGPAYAQQVDMPLQSPAAIPPAPYTAETSPSDAAFLNRQAGEDIDEEASDEEEEEDDDLLDLDITTLRKTSVAPAFDEVVTTVSRQESTVGRSPTAVFVVTQEMICRSGARTIPDVLRLVPGVQVAQVDSNKWAISIRGFQHRFASNLQVQIDGRSVYNNSFAGVYWDQPDLLLEDIHRIEVVRGPGATVWGANAVNGIINILTKSAKDTQGTYAILGGGSEEHGFAGARVGGSAAGGDIHWRLWGKWKEVDQGFVAGADEFDDWRQIRGGLRMDWTPNTCDTVTMQAGAYGGESGGASTLPVIGFFAADEEIRGAHFLSRWTRDLGEDGSFALQAYYDYSERTEGVTNSSWDIIDIDFQVNRPQQGRHNTIWGVRFHNTVDEFSSNTTPAIVVYPDASRGFSVISAFLQDEITLAEDQLYLTAGMKIEHNDFTGFEFQPSVRLLAMLDERRVAWGAVSRAVRRPGTANKFAAFPNFGIIESTGLQSENVIAYEMGYRAQPKEYFSWDVALFYNDYTDQTGLQLVSFPPPTLQFANTISGQTYGTELSAKLQMNDYWRVTGNYSYIRPQGDFTNTIASIDNTARNRFNLWSSWDLTENSDLDVIGRYVDNVEGLDNLVQNYFTMDIRYAWRPNRNTEVAIVGRNLLDSEHLEFANPTFNEPLTEVQRSVYGSITWRR